MRRRSRTTGGLALLLVLVAGACGDAPDGSGASPTTTPTTTAAADPTSITTEPVTTAPTTTAPPAPTVTEIAPTTSIACGARRADDHLAQVEAFLRAAARGEDVDAQIATETYLGPDGSIGPAPEILDKFRAPLGQLRALGPELHLVELPELTRVCEAPGCGFYGDFHTMCIVAVARDDRPRVIVGLAWAAMGYDTLYFPDAFVAEVVARRAARGDATTPYFSTDIVDADGTRHGRTDDVEALASALRDLLAGQHHSASSCTIRDVHRTCTTRMAGVGGAAITFVLAPNVDAGWAVESWTAA